VRVVDVHAHLGLDYTFDHDFRREYLVHELEQLGADVLIVQPGTTHDLETARAQHDEIAAFAKAYPGRIYGMANPSPHLPRSDYQAEVARCVRELGFVAVKLHPLAHAVGPDLKAGRLVVETANELGIPVMVHTGAGVPFALPSAVVPVAQRNPETKIVLAHSGGPLFSDEALLAAQLCPNVYLEASWISYDRVRTYSQTIGAQRVMMGADHAANLPVELAKFRAAGLTEEELEWCLGRTAAEFFGLPS
jgi:predicted TIM-barrel fold metal-dependent hydrolase